VTRSAFALLGSGEFEPWTEPVDRVLLERSPRPTGPVLILPTASAPEGDAVFDRWASMGTHHFDDLGIASRVVPLKTSEDAGRDEVVASIEDASFAYFSGGNPAYLAGVLRGSAFWSALTDAIRAGLPYAGCSAGVNALGETALDSAALSFDDRLWKPGLGLFLKTWFGVHWDMVDTFIPGARDFIAGSVPAGHRLVAIDEHTALVGDGTAWTVMGSSTASTMKDGQWEVFHSGSAFALDLPLSLRPSPEAAPA
jgi:cyanophycinase